MGVALLCEAGVSIGATSLRSEFGPASRIIQEETPPAARAARSGMNVRFAVNRQSAIGVDPQDSATIRADRERTRRTALYFGIVGLYLLVAAVLLAVWRRTGFERPALSLALLAILMAIHAAAVSGSLPAILWPAVDAHAAALIRMSTYFLMNAVIAFVLWALFPDAFYPAHGAWTTVAHSMIGGLAAVSGVTFGAVVLVVGDPAPTVILTASKAITIVLMIVAAALALRAVERRLPNHVETAVGLGLLIVGCVYFVLFASSHGPGRPFLVTFAFLGFILLQGYTIVRQRTESAERSRANRRAEEEEVTRQALQAASVVAQAANMAKTEFVTAITHELRTPLTSMLGYIQLLRDELEEDLTDPQLEFLDTLETSGERLLNLVNNLLDLARIESDRVELIIGPTDMKAVVKMVLAELYPLAREKNLYLRSEIDSEDTVALADEQWIKVVLTNLVSNAIKYTDEGGVTVRITRSTIDARNAIAVHVVDTGRGISVEFMPELFERFTREDDAHPYAPTGTGLGLTISREVLSRMGGEIVVESRKGEGTTFTVLLLQPDESGLT